MERAVAEGDVRVAECTLGHPRPGERLLRVGESWGVHLRDPGASRVNRDAYRRAVGHSALVAELETATPFGEDGASGSSEHWVPWKDWRIIGTGVGILLLATLFLVLGLMLAR
jgi:hypothetical protein